MKAGWCGDEACEDPIKEAIAAEIVMVPLDRDEEPIHDECAICGEDAEETAYFAKSTDRLSLAGTRAREPGSGSATPRSPRPVRPGLCPKRRLSRTGRDS
ncbi:hypothetical protein ACFQH8_18640 [Halomicroarcula sp. GCM10025710]